MQKLKLIFISLLCALLVACIFIFNGVIGDGIKSGLFLCAVVIVPSLFPFMALCSFIQNSGLLRLIGTRLNKLSMFLFRLPGAAFPAILMSFFAGYPAGARLAKSLYKSGDLSLSQAKKMSCCAISAGPAFLVLAVGSGMLHSKTIGWILLSAHLLSSLIVAVMCGRLIKSDKQDILTPKKDTPFLMDAFVEGVAEASAGILSICAFTILFSAIVAVIKTLFGGDFGRLIISLLEVTNGCAYASASDSSVPIIAAITGFGGISVLCQIVSGAGPARPKLRLLLSFRVIHAALSYSVTAILIRIIPNTAISFSNLSSPTPKLSEISIPFSLALLVLCVVFLFSTFDKSKKRLLDFF